MNSTSPITPKDDELIERLRTYKPYSLQGKPFGPAVCEQAATRLTELKEALADFVAMRDRWLACPEVDEPEAARLLDEAHEKARTALSTQGKQGDE